MRLSYRKKLFFYFLIVFAVFAAIVVFVQQNRERTFRNDEFKRGMDVYATLISKYIAENHLTAPVRCPGLTACCRCCPGICG